MKRIVLLALIIDVTACGSSSPSSLSGHDGSPPSSDASRGDAPKGRVPDSGGKDGDLPDHTTSDSATDARHDAISASDASDSGRMAEAGDDALAHADARLDAPDRDAVTSDAAEAGCSVGALGCQGDQPTICTGGGTRQNVGAPCSGSTPACLAGACVPCAPMATRCADVDGGAGGVEACGDAGQWGNPVACAVACTDGGTCGGSCVPDSRDCSGVVSRTCDTTGTWQPTTTCPFVCAGAGVCSGECIPTTKACADATGTETCDTTGTWVVSACPFVCSGAGACTGVCTPTAQQCLADQGQLCDATGAWGNQGGACNYECNAAAIQCSCSAPGRFTITQDTYTLIVGATSTQVPYTALNDAVTGYTWFIPSGLSGANPCAVYVALAHTSVAIPGFFEPTIAELSTLIAQVAPVTACSTFDGDPVLQTFGIAGQTWGSMTLVAGQESVMNLSTGQVSTPAPIGATVSTICVEP
jgi:hypothetical protein